MIDVQIRRARDGNRVKITGRVENEVDRSLSGQVMAIVDGGKVHLISDGLDLTHKDWSVLASKIDNEIARMEQSAEATNGTPSDS